MQAVAELPLGSMAGLRVRLLLVLTVILFLDSVWCWEWVSPNEQQSFYVTEKWDEQLGPSDDDDYDYDAVSSPEGDPTSASYSHVSAPHTFPEKGDDSDSSYRASDTDPNFQVDFVTAPPRTWNSGLTSKSTWLDVFCSDTDFQMTLLKGQMSNVYVLGLDDLLPVMEAPGSCGYRVNPLKGTLTVAFTGCNVNAADNYVLQLLYIDRHGETLVATASCEEGIRGDLDYEHSQHHVNPHNVFRPTTASTPAVSPAHKCLVSPGERVTCGQPGISSADCKKRGCCVNSAKSACYYPLDECTTDRHFIFAIRYNSASVVVNPTKLVIPGTNCKPVIVNDKVAIFKFKVTECGVRAYKIGVTTIYLARVQTAVQVLDLKYGAITRSDPLRFMVECRYSQKGNDQELLVSTGYMVMTPTSILPSTIIGNGLYAVQLRLATDHTYSSYFPNDHPPLKLLLGNPVYLELNLVTPKPQAVILVKYCVAYPVSARNALVLIYEGCANPYDPNVSVLKVMDHPRNRHQRRFLVEAFQFMDQRTNRYLNEEIYFMCSTEVCRPSEKQCENQCFDS